MELDVHIDRVGDEPWGFRLIGGVDFDMALTVVKVLPDSPAERAGLRNGDTVQYINDVVSTDMSHQDSRQAVAAATDILTLGVTRQLLIKTMISTGPKLTKGWEVKTFGRTLTTLAFTIGFYTKTNRLIFKFKFGWLVDSMKFYLVYKNNGLYDPVLDDQEPIFEPIDQEDFDQPSRPTEVPFCLQEFTDTPKQNELPDFSETLQLPEFRSLTASPFLVSTKPYRPFSTEPLPEIPPLEDPIILNPEYNDAFDEMGLEDFLPKTRFKLPISEQYDPDGKKSQNITKQIISTKVDTENMRMRIDKEECIEKMKTEIDLENIKITANSLVDRSIEKAVTVAAEIKKEIDIELRESSITCFDERESIQSSRDVIESNLKKQTLDFTSEASPIKSKETPSKNAADLVSLMDKTTEDIIKKIEVSVAKEVEKFEKVDTNQQAVEERRLSTKHNIEEAITEGSGKSKSSFFNKETEFKISEKNKDLQRNKGVEESKTKNIKATQKDVQQKVSEKQTAESTVKSESIRSESDTKRSSDTKMSSSRLLAEQRTYAVGLQTIPNIKGTIHSSYHYNLLLKTFFIHLTDVMVALSRFISDEPLLLDSRKKIQEQKQNLDTKEIVMETVSINKDYEKISGTVDNIKNKEQKKENTVKNYTHETVIEAVEEKNIQDQQVEAVVEEDILNDFDMEEGERRMLSGAEMAQLTERKSEELSSKMKAVISEFQIKTGIEETAGKTESVRERRSRSRSKLQEILEIETTSAKVSSSVSESVKIESRQESKDVKEFKSKDGKQIYVAIVESHVYTNKDAIFEDQVTAMAESSAASLQTAEKINIALEINEGVSTENVAIENIQVREEVAKAIIEESHELSSNVKTEPAVQIIEQKTQHSEAVQIEEINDESEKKEFVESKVIGQHVAEINPIIELAEETKQESGKSAIEIEEISELEIIEELVSEVDKILEVTTETQKGSVIVHNIESTKTPSTKLKENREEASDVSETKMIVKKAEVYITKQVEETVTKNKYESYESKVEESFVSQQIDQESTFVAKSVETAVSLRDRKEALTLNLCKDVAQVKKLESQISASSDEDISTPTPSTVPPTPLTDEYIFKLKIALPKGITPVPPDLSPDSEHDEDPLIVKKNLIPHIETKVEEVYIYDPPLPTPLGSPKKVCSPVYTKPGLRGGADRKEISRRKKEEILEIERKSSLLASAIDQTIKSIEEYKEDVGIETKKPVTESKTFKSEQTSFQETPVVYNGYAKVVETKIYETPIKNQEPVVEDKRVTVDKQITSNIIEESKFKTVSIETEQIESKVDFEFNTETIDMIGKEINASMNDVNLTKTDPMEGYRPVQFNLEEIQDAKRGLRSTQINSRFQEEMQDQTPRQIYMTETGEVLGTHQGIVDGLEEAVVDAEVAKEQGKPGITEDKIAELISGESEMLREAHVMGLSRVITSHMHRANDDSSVDFNKLKPTIESLNRSEVLKALNEELMKAKEEKKKDDRKWTTFLQKPKRAVPRVKFGYYGYTEPEEDVEEPYKVKIVKQPKPKVAPDYKSEDFNTGLLPWEERALREPTPPPVAPEEPILIPEEAPEILEAVDPLPESEVPDLEDSGIPLPSPTPEEDTPEPIEETEVEEVLDLEPVVEEIVEEEDKLVEEMEQSKIAEQIMMSVQNMVDANAPLEQQLAQMRAQLVALAQLPGVIQQSLELVSRQLGQLSQMEFAQTVSQSEVTTETNEESEVTQNHIETNNEEVREDSQTSTIEVEENGIANETQQEVKQAAEEFERMRIEEEAILEEQRKIEKQRKEIMEQARLEQESRQLKQRPTPRVGKPKPVFGPATPQDRPVVLPGGRRWRKPEDAYNEQFIAETLSAQAEIIKGKAKGFPYESVRLPYDERINFMKYEKPPVSLDHLQNSDTYKMVHNMEQAPAHRVNMRTPAIAEADYREKCRSITPCTERMAMEEHLDIPQQVQP